MTIVMQLDLPASKADLEKVSAEMETHQNPPEGLIIHVVAELPMAYVVDVWESQAAFEKFPDLQPLANNAELDG